MWSRYVFNCDTCFINFNLLVLYCIIYWTTVQQLTDAGSNYLTQLATEGSAQLQNSIRHGILNLTYDFEKGVFAEWNSDGTQRSDDPCTFIPFKPKQCH